jgi:hypothetical protein
MTELDLRPLTEAIRAEIAKWEYPPILSQEDFEKIARAVVPWVATPEVAEVVGQAKVVVALYRQEGLGYKPRMMAAMVPLIRAVDDLD